MYCFFLDQEGTQKLGTILAFATGANTVPPIGFFPQPSIEFLHQEQDTETAHCKHLHQLLEAATAHLLQSLSGKHGFCIGQYPWLWIGLIVDRPLSQYSVKGQNVSKHADNPETFFV